MKRAALKTAYITLLALCLLLVGCRIETKPGARPVHGDRDEQVLDDAVPKEPVREPVLILSRSIAVNGCTVSYPHVYDANMNLLNTAIFSAFSELAGQCSASSQLTYTTNFNSLGLLSFTLVCKSAEGKTLLIDTANFDVDTGRRIKLSECFGSSTEYAGRLGDIVRRFVETGDHTPIGDIPPVDDDRLFVFTRGGLFLIYREYELCTFDSGVMRIRVSLGAVNGCIAGDGLLNRML